MKRRHKKDKARLLMAVATDNCVVSMLNKMYAGSYVALLKGIHSLQNKDGFILITEDTLIILTTKGKQWLIKIGYKRAKRLKTDGEAFVRHKLGDFNTIADAYQYIFKENKKCG